MTNDSGRSPSGPGRSPSGLSQSPLSQAQPSVPNALYLLWASQGEYSDRSEWAVALYTQQADGEADARRGEALHRDIHSRTGYDRARQERLLKETDDGRELRRIMGQDAVHFYDDLTLYCCEVEIRQSAASAIEAAAAGETGNGPDGK